MPRPGQLTAEELRWLCEAARDGLSASDALNGLPPMLAGRVRDPKPARAALAIFRKLYEDRTDGHPITVLTPSEELTADDRRLGIMSAVELPGRARVSGYRLKEPQLLRMMAIYQHVMIRSEGRTPSPGGAPLPRADVYPTTHEGALLEARDRVATSFTVVTPRVILDAFFDRLGHEAPDPRTIERPGTDLLVQQFREHTAESEVWVRSDTWLAAVETYRGAVETFAASWLADTATAAGLEPRWETPWDPISRPVFETWFVRIPLRYALDLIEGAAPQRWSTVLGRINPAEQDSPWNLLLDGTVVASGPSDVMEQAQTALDRLFTDLAHSADLRALHAQRPDLAKSGDSIVGMLHDILPTQIHAGRCWGCPSSLELQETPSR